MIEVLNLCVRFGDVEVLQKVNLHVNEGERVGILGMSGCGKSTLLRTIAGFKVPCQGTISIGGRKVDNFPPNKRGIAYMPQRHAVFPALSVWGNLALGVQKPTKVDDIARSVKIDHLLERTTGLSGGEERRVALGRALGTSNKVLLLDEPFSSLDAPMQISLRQEVEQVITTHGLTVVVVTHDIRDLSALKVDHLGIMQAGKMIQYGLFSEVLNFPVNNYAAALMQKSDV
jgi:ABC-type sugar transport system ATPase subunit